MSLKCPACGKEFETRLGMRIHHAKAHGESLVQVNCEICGKTFPNYKGDRRFCSKECAGVYFSELYSSGKTADCEVCGKEFHISPSHPRRFCSRECYLESLSVIKIDKAKLLDLIRRSPYGTGTLSKAAKIHPDELQRLIGREEGKFLLVRKLEAIIGDFR